MQNKKGRYSIGPFLLFPYVREQRHEPRLLDRGGELALMLGADVRVSRVDDLCLARNKTLQKINFLIINIFEVLRTEKALLNHSLVKSYNVYQVRQG
jgi:hypothetical protein